MNLTFFKDKSFTGTSSVQVNSKDNFNNIIQSKNKNFNKGAEFCVSQKNVINSILKDDKKPKDMLNIEEAQKTDLPEQNNFAPVPTKRR